MVREAIIHYNMSDVRDIPAVSTMLITLFFIILFASLGSDIYYDSYIYIIQYAIIWIISMPQSGHSLVYVISIQASIKIDDKLPY